MSRYNLVSALAVIAVLGTALASGAQNAPMTPGQGMGPGNGMGPGHDMGMGGPGEGMMAGLVWEMLDSNGDGSVTAEEIAAAAKARFDEADTDKDGFLSVEEVTAAADRMAAERAAQLRAQMAERMVDRQDDNGDGKLSPDELRMARMGEGFLERFDTDGDGTVTKAEYDAAMTSMQRGHMGKSERKGKGRMRERGGHHDGDGGGWFGWRLGRDHH